MYYLMILVFALLSSGCIAGGARTVTAGKLGNTKTTAVQKEADWAALITKSNVVITGTAEETFYVIDESKLFEKKSNASNIVRLPNLRDGVKGVLVRFRVQETIYKMKGLEVNKSITIYVKGGHTPPMHADVPIFVAGKQYLVFLTAPLQSENFPDAKVIQPRDLSKGTFNFNHKSSFKVTNNRNGLFSFDKYSVESVKALVKEL